jgi:[acyl-carrier-protein] S-malonyltransferase
MYQSLYQGNEVFKSTIDQASAVLEYDLWQVISENPDDQLNKTEYTQPALLACSIAAYRAYLDAGGKMPSVMAGHSLGEYSALVAAGNLSFETALSLVRLRGQLMQQAVPEGTGAMAAVLNLTLEQINTVCSQLDGVVEAANINAPGQIVVAGDATAVEQSLPLFKGAGARRALPLPVSVPSHCSLMKPAAEQLQKALSLIEIEASAIPVVHNVSAQPVRNPDEIKTMLVQQLYSSVRWVDCVETLKAFGIEYAVECGPGNVLAGLVKRIDKALPVKALNSDESLAALVS